MKLLGILIAGVTLLGLTACGTVKGTAKDIEIVGKNIGSVATGEVVPAYDEEGNPQFTIGEMPKGYHENADHMRHAVNTGGVMLHDQYTGFSAPGASLPPLMGGVNAYDSSVTIFPLNSDMQRVFQGQAPASMTMGAGPQFFAPSSNTMTSSDNQIFFNHGSSRLGSGDKRKLSSIVQNTSGPITVEGYASRPTQVGSQSVQSHILNLKESMNRSFAVSKELLRKGIPPENITTVSHGAGKATGVATQDRRVDINTGF